MGFVSRCGGRCRLRCGSCCRCAWGSVAGRRENGRRAAHRILWSAPPNCILNNVRQRTSVRAEARARFGAGDVDSCGAPAERRRGSEEKLRGGEALDNLHGPAAKRTSPQRVNGQCGRRGACCWRIGWLEQPETEWKKLRSPAVSKKSEVADAHEAARQQVQQEAAQELFNRESHEPLLVAVGGVAPATSISLRNASSLPTSPFLDNFRAADQPPGTDFRAARDERDLVLANDRYGFTRTRQSVYVVLRFAPATEARVLACMLAISALSLPTLPEQP